MAALGTSVGDGVGAVAAVEMSVAGGGGGAAPATTASAEARETLDGLLGCRLRFTLSDERVVRSCRAPGKFRARAHALA